MINLFAHVQFLRLHVSGIFKISIFSPCALFCRPSLLRSLLQPESIRLDWLCLAVSLDAPQRANTVDVEGNPR